MTPGVAALLVGLGGVSSSSCGAYLPQFRCSLRILSEFSQQVSVVQDSVDSEFFRLNRGALEGFGGFGVLSSLDNLGDLSSLPHLSV